MSSNRTDFILNSLRSRVWLAICALAGLNCISGLAAFLASSFLFSSPVAPVLLAFSISAVITIAYGRWLASEVIRPVERVNLAAKSIERNPLASLPSTTGSTETDEVLFSLQRNNCQIQNLLTLMDEVAAGRTENAVLPLDSPDRISTSFQKLVMKVTDSIDAQENVDEILRSISSIETDLRIARAGSFRNEIRSFSAHTSGLAKLMNAVLVDLAELRRTVQDNLRELSPFFVQAMEAIKQSAGLSDAFTRSMNKMISDLKSTPDRVRQVGAELQPVLLPDGELAGVFRDGSAAVRGIAQHAGKTRKHVNELQRNLRKLRERTCNLSTAVRLVEDISRRSNLITLNSSLEAPNTDATSTFLDEFKLVSERAGRVQREITDIEKSIATEIDETEASIRELLSETAETLVGTAAAAGFIEQLNPVISALDEIPSRLEVITGNHAGEREILMKTLTAGYFELEKSTPLLRESERRMESLKQCIENLVQATDAHSAAEPGILNQVSDLNFDGGPSETLASPLEIPGEN